MSPMMFLSKNDDPLTDLIEISLFSLVLALPLLFYVPEFSLD
jgi:hypothetical protein